MGAYDGQHGDIDRLDRRPLSNDTLLNRRSRIIRETALKESDRETIRGLEGSGLCR